jgi:hypothetical protein
VHRAALTVGSVGWRKTLKGRQTSSPHHAQPGLSTRSLPRR